MYVFAVDCYAEMASFRIPESHTFQQTLPLPPITTLWGIAGAALGLEYSQACSWIQRNEVQVGVWGRNEGVTKDLWKYSKVKDKEVIKDVLLRESLSNLNICIVFGSPNQDVSIELRSALRKPKFALTVGDSDSLLKVKRITDVLDLVSAPELSLEFTIIRGNLSGTAKLAADLKSLPITERINAPQVHLLPMSFRFTGIERRVSQREYFTFVQSKVEFIEPVAAFTVSGRKVTLL